MYNITVKTGIATYNVTNLGPEGSNASVEINGQGPIHFNDVGNRKLGPGTKTWGVCITFRDNVWAFRYDNQGALEIIYDAPSKSLKLTPANNGTVTQLTS